MTKIDEYNRLAPAAENTTDNSSIRALNSIYDIGLKELNCIHHAALCALADQFFSGLRNLKGLHSYDYKTSVGRLFSYYESGREPLDSDYISGLEALASAYRVGLHILQSQSKMEERK